MMKLNRVLIISAALAVGAAAAVVAQNFDNVEIKTEKVADGLYVLTGRGGNIGVMTGADGTILIDDQYGPLSPKIKTAVQAITDKPIRAVINTHWHGDHVGGNLNFATDGAEIFAQENVRKRMGESHVFTFGTEKDTIPPSPQKAWPVVTFNDGVTLHLDGEDITVVHVPPAHTDGDSYVWFPHLNVLHAGDLLFNGFYPRIDAVTGGRIDGMIHADDLLIALVNDQTKIIPGHGPLADKAALKRFRDMLADVRQRVAKQIHDHRTKEQMIASHFAADIDSVWGKGFMKPADFLGGVYDDLASHQDENAKGAKK
jgi:cyclase